MIKVLQGKEFSRDQAEVFELQRKYERLNTISPLYDDIEGRRLSYPERVRQINDEFEDLIFSLAGERGETIESLKKKTLGEIDSFIKRLNNGRRH